MQLFNFLFFPGLEKRRSFLLSHPLLIVYVVVIASIIFLNQVLLFKMPSVLGYAKNVTVADLMIYTNSERNKQGLASLEWNEQLAKAAYAKANDMFDKDYWAHNSPDGKEPWDFILGSGYDYLYAGENLAVDFSDSSNVIQAWIDSPSHRDNLFSDKYTQIGFAVVNGELEGRKTTLVVQMFGYPRVSPPLALSDSVSAEEEEISTIKIIEPDIELVSQVEASSGSVLNANDVFNASRYIALILGFFLTGLFVIDEYYVRQIGLNRISGNTIIHIIVLLVAIAGIWYTNIGLVL